MYIVILVFLGMASGEVVLAATDAASRIQVVQIAGI